MTGFMLVKLQGEECSWLSACLVATEGVSVRILSSHSVAGERTFSLISNRQLMGAVLGQEEVGTTPTQGPWVVVWLLRQPADTEGGARCVL